MQPSMESETEWGSDVSVCVGGVFPPFAFGAAVVCREETANSWQYLGVSQCKTSVRLNLAMTSPEKE